MECPECGGTTHPDGTETVCTDCGLVVDEDAIDHSPEWRDFGNDGESKSRVGATRTVTRHDNGLSTTFELRKDSNGNTLSGATRKKFKRLKKWHNRSQSVGSDTRIYALAEIRRVVGSLSLSESVQERASKLFREAQDTDLVQGRNLDSFAGAAVYAALRDMEIPRLLETVADSVRADPSEIRNDYYRMNRELGLPLKPPTPALFLPKVAFEANVSDIARKRAADVVAVFEENEGHIGRNPAGIAAGALAYVSDVSSKKMADAANVSPTTVRAADDDIDALGPYPYEELEEPTVDVDVDTTSDVEVGEENDAGTMRPSPEKSPTPGLARSPTGTCPGAEASSLLQSPRYRPDSSPTYIREESHKNSRGRPTHRSRTRGLPPARGKSRRQPHCLRRGLQYVGSVPVGKLRTSHYPQPTFHGPTGGHSGNTLCPISTQMQPNSPTPYGPSAVSTASCPRLVAQKHGSPQLQRGVLRPPPRVNEYNIEPPLVHCH